MTVRAILILALAALLTGSGWWARGIQAERDVAHAAAAHAQALRSLADAATTASEHARAAERGASDRIHAIATEAHDAIQNAYRDAAAADRVAQQLRQHIARLVAPAAGGAASDPGAAAAGPPAAGPGLVLADVLGRADGRAGELARFADQAHAAGLACERAFDAVRLARTP